MEWIEQIADSFVWFVPLAATLGLALARLSAGNSQWRTWTQRVFFASLLVVSGGTLRTILTNEPSWFLHTLSLGVMVIGALCPQAATEPLEGLDF